MIDRNAQRLAKQALELVTEVQDAVDSVDEVRGVKMGLQEDAHFWLGISLLLSGEYKLIELHREGTEEYPNGFIRLSCAN